MNLRIVLALFWFSLYSYRCVSLKYLAVKTDLWIRLCNRMEELLGKGCTAFVV